MSSCGSFQDPGSFILMTELSHLPKRVSTIMSESKKTDLSKACNVNVAKMSVEPIMVKKHGDESKHFDSQSHWPRVDSDPDSQPRWSRRIDSFRIDSPSLEETRLKVLSLVLSCLAVWLISGTVSGADPSVGWCYHLPSCNESTWPSIAGAYCNGTRQSPINIVTASVKANEDLTALKFKGFNDSTALTEIKNGGHEVKVMLNHEKMAVEGGALPGVYNSRQFHLHWGSGSSVPGAEHTVDGKRYAMELHIVNVKAEYSSTADALADLTGLAALGFFIEATNDTGKPKSWKTLTSYLANIPNAGDTAALTQPISMDGLLEGVNRSRYYRYLGSLTVPSCNEAVVWTVFKDPVRVSRDLVDLFSTRLYVNKSTNSPLMTNTFRRTQSINGRVVTSQVGSSKASLPSTSAATRPFLSFSFIAALMFVAFCWD